MKNILTNWNFIRAHRLLLGIIIIVQGIDAKEWMFALAGVLLSGMAIANIGMCRMGGCQVSPRKNIILTSFQEIQDEKIH